MSKTLLVVENEAALRDLYKRELEASGYKVNTARSGEEALYCLNHDNVDLLVIDIETQSKSDQNYLKEFLDINADIKVIINTSYPDFNPDFNEWSADS